MSDYITRSNISPELLAAIEKVTAKRAKTVLEHILEYGFVTTEDLARYNYEHAPRAARDVREHGIELETFRVKSSNGRSIAAYRLVDNVAGDNNKSGRKNFSKKFKQVLLKENGNKCSLCGGEFLETILQIDHKVPYEVSGDRHEERNLEDFMLLCPSCNRGKSWTCEHCKNWSTMKMPSMCQICMFASPNKYEHIAMKEKRSLTLVWEATEVQHYESLERDAHLANQDIRQYAKDMLKAKYGKYNKK